MSDADGNLARVRELMDAIPFNRHLGIVVGDLGPGRARLEVPFADTLIGDFARPAIHGGVLSALIDTAGGAAAFTLVEITAGDRVSTIDLRIDYLRPGLKKRLIAEAEVVRLGNRVATVDIVCFHEGERERLIATGKGAYNIKRAGD